MAAKQYAVVVTFPNAPAGHTQQAVRAAGSDPSIAVSRGIKQAMYQLRKATKHRGLYEAGSVSWKRIEQPRESAGPEPESQASKHCDAGYMNDMRFGDSDGQ